MQKRKKKKGRAKGLDKYFTRENTVTTQIYTCSVAQDIMKMQIKTTMTPLPLKMD